VHHLFNDLAKNRDARTENVRKTSSDEMRLNDPLQDDWRVWPGAFTRDVSSVVSSNLSEGFPGPGGDEEGGADNEEDAKQRRRLRLR